MMTASSCGFFLNAMCGGHLDIVSYASTTGTLKEREAMWEQEGIAKVSPQVPLSDWPEFGKREHFQALHANMNEPIVFQDIARYRVW